MPEVHQTPNTYHAHQSLYHLHSMVFTRLMSPSPAPSVQHLEGACTAEIAHGIRFDFLCFMMEGACSSQKHCTLFFWWCVAFQATRLGCNVDSIVLTFYPKAAKSGRGGSVLYTVSLLKKADHDMITIYGLSKYQYMLPPQCCRHTRSGTQNHRISEHQYLEKAPETFTRPFRLLPILFSSCVLHHA